MSKQLTGQRDYYLWCTEYIYIYIDNKQIPHTTRDGVHHDVRHSWQRKKKYSRSIWIRLGQWVN